MKLSRRFFPVLIAICFIFIFLPKAFSFTDSQKQILKDLKTAEIIYLGERHDSQADHAAQLAIIQHLQASNPRIAIAFEMFQRPYQIYLDQYLAGKITENQLREKSEYDQRWGFDWEFYAPILRFARAKQLPAIALNTPTEITRKVAQGGLESLSTSEMTYIPPKSEINTDNEEYRQQILSVYQQHTGGKSQGFERFFLAQVLWDETMADAIAKFWQAHPHYQIVVLAGKGHIAYGYGIPSRVKRRLGDRIQQRSVLLGYDPQLWQKETSKPADYFWPHQNEASQ
jgi:uncharacterized iron-regulated protein